MTTQHQVQQSHINLMQITTRTLECLLSNVTQVEAQSWRDGGDGWTILEVLGHLRDFDTIFRERAQMMLTQEHPALPAYDHEAMAIENRYNDMRLKDMMQQFVDSRAETMTFFQNMPPENWEHSGIHPEKGEFSMTDAVMQVAHHDMVHIEQLVKIMNHRAG